MGTLMDGTRQMRGHHCPDIWGNRGRSRLRRKVNFRLTLPVLSRNQIQTGYLVQIIFRTGLPSPMVGQCDQPRPRNLP